MCDDSHSSSGVQLWLCSSAWSSRGGSAALSCSPMRLFRRVHPASHPLRRIRKLTDQALERLNPSFCELYDVEGRQSVLPAQPVLASLLHWFYWIRFKRLLLGAAPLQSAVSLPGLEQFQTFEEQGYVCCRVPLRVPLW